MHSAETPSLSRREELSAKKHYPCHYVTEQTYEPPYASSSFVDSVRTEASENNCQEWDAHHSKHRYYSEVEDKHCQGIPCRILNWTTATREV